MYDIIGALSEVLHELSASHPVDNQILYMCRVAGSGAVRAGEEIRS